MWKGQVFHGAKLALLCDRSILTYLRDDKSDIPFPGFWDLPGGGREGDEAPVECVLRELQEEFSLYLAADRVEWGRFYPSVDDRSTGSFFFAATITAEEIAAIRFGDEGQAWRMMDVTDFATHKLAVPNLASRVKDMLNERHLHF